MFKQTSSPSLVQSIVSKERLHSLAIIWTLVRRELKVKYRGTVLGYLWSMLNPLLFMITISFVFSHLVKGIENYSIYVLAGILFWNMTLMTVVSGAHSIVSNASLIQKVRVPIWVFPLVPLGTSLTNLLLALIPYFIIAFASGAGVSLQLLLLPVVILATGLFLCGLSLTLGSLNVFFRDVAHVLEPVMTLLFYATPIIYDRNTPSMPAHIREMLGLNPLAHFVEAFRATLFPGATPISLNQLALIFSLGLLSFFIGWTVYKRAKSKISLNL